MTNYDIGTELTCGPLELIDLGAMADGCTAKWWNRSLVRINDSVARVGVFHGEFHFHKHDREDELFYVVEGKLLVDVEGQPTFELGPRQGVMVPRGVVHRTRAPTRTVVLIIEAASVTPTGD